MTDAPFFSVILCVHRNHSYLGDAIRSVLGQSDPDFEFLIGANACDDELMQALDDLVGQDHRVRIFRTDIGQLAFNLNLLADKARGEYLVRMDSDDVSEPYRIAVLREALGKQPLDVLGSWVSLIDINGDMLGEMRLPCEHQAIVHALPWRTVFCHPAVAIRREYLLKLRGYLGGFVSEDSDLWLRAVLAGGRLGNLPQVLLRYRLHAEQSTVSRRGYSEVASHWLRELLAQPSWFLAKGFSIAVAKRLVSPWLGHLRDRRVEDGS
jgi:glycosyltransferase involved in cell wall biosynthesis